MKKGYFISIEGIEGAGKSTLIDQLKTQALFEAEVIYTREPGGCPIAEKLREILIDKDHSNIEGLTELFLVYAARHEHITKVIVPALAAGKVVITDRFLDASYAYQGGGRHIDEGILKLLDSWVVKDCMPDLTILMKAPVDMCLERVNQRHTKDRFDKETASFFAAAQEKYLQRAEQNPERFLVIDSSTNINKSLEEAKQAIQALAG